MTGKSDRPEVDDPRVLALARARQQLAYENPFNAVCPPWDGLTDQEQHLSLLEARSYLHAAQNAGLVTPVGQAPDTDRAGLREQIADALARLDAEKWGVEIPPRDHPFWQMYPAQADAVLAVLPAPADRAAVAELAQAIRLTREYVGEELLPAVEGWSWYDALRRHAPHELPDEAVPAVVSAVPGQTDGETTFATQVWPLARVLAEVRCGSQDWTWDEEWADLDRRHAETGYLDKLTEDIRANGITMPVLIGTDGRLWDGHHRLRIAVRLGIGYVPVEVPAVEQPAAGAQQPKEDPPSTTEELLATRCDACRHTLARHHQRGACTVVLCVCGTFQHPVEELPQ